MAETERSTRADKIRQERRSKPGAVAHSGMKLGVNEALLDRKVYEYRWVNDKGNRVQSLTDQDWDPVHGETVKEDSDGVGTVNSKVVGMDGAKPMSAILMRKRKDWYREDQKVKQKPLDEVDEAIRRGVNHAKDSPELANGVGYTPNGRNTVSRV